MIQDRLSRNSLPLFHLGKAFILDDEPCQTKLVLPSLAQRQENYTLKTGERQLCDYFLVDGWYKIDNFTIATSNIRCGTKNTWHINGKTEEMHAYHSHFKFVIVLCSFHCFARRITSKIYMVNFLFL